MPDNSWFISSLDPIYLSIMSWTSVQSTRQITFLAHALLTIWTNGRAYGQSDFLSSERTNDSKAESVQSIFAIESSKIRPITVNRFITIQGFDANEQTRDWHEWSNKINWLRESICSDAEHSSFESATADSSLASFIAWMRTWILSFCKLDEIPAGFAWLSDWLRRSELSCCEDSNTNGKEE